MPESLFKRKWHVLSISLSTLAAFLLLYILRNADDNRLTSWKWAFADVELVWFIPCIVLGIIFIYALLHSPITRQKPALFLFLFSFAICAIFWRAPEVIVDTSRYFTQAKHLEVYGIKYFLSEWGKVIHAWTDLPLVPFLYGLIFKYLGESRAFIQVFNTLMFSMTVVCTYLIGRSLWDEDTGFIAGTLLLGIPYVFSQTPLMLVDVPTMFFLTVSIVTFIKSMEKGGLWIVIAAISIFCAVFSKYSSWMMLSVLGVVFLVYLRQGSGVKGQGGDIGTRNPQPANRNCIYRGVMVVFIAGVLIGLMVFLKYDVISRQIIFLREYQAPGLRRWGESFTSTFLFQIHPFITIAALYSVYEAFRKKDLKFLIVFWLILLIILFQIRRSRYVMVAFPMITLMASYGLQKIKTFEIRRYTVSCIVAVSLAVAMFAYMPFLQSMSLVNVKNAGSFLNAIDEEKVEVFIIPSKKSAVNSSITVPILDLFLAKGIIYHNDENFSLPFKKIEKSPLRFTWEYKNPGYYMHDQKDRAEYPAVAVISNRDVKMLPERIEEKVKGYEKIRIFGTTTGLFRYSPIVSIYLPQKS